MKAFFLTLFFTLNLFAESGSVSYHAAFPDQLAPDQVDHLCAELKKDPNCPFGQKMLRDVTGLTSTTCAAQQRTLNCPAFLSATGQTNRSMRCEPYEICRTAQDITFIRGCKAFGFDVGKSLWDGFTKCASDYRCLATEELKMVATIFFPGQMAAEQAKHVLPAARSFVNGIRDDFKRYPKLACLDPDTRAKFQCYMLAKYGGMAATTIATAGEGAALFAEMAAVEGGLSGLTLEQILTKTLSRSLGADVRVSEKVTGQRSFNRLTDQAGHELGGFGYEVRGDVLDIDFIDLKPGYQGKGGSRTIMQHILRKHPEVKKIETFLIDDNRDAFRDAVHAGRSCVEALMATPAFKIRASAGFARLGAHTCDPDNLKMTVTR